MSIIANPDPPTSALADLIHSQRPSTCHSVHHHNLSLQIQHNLQYQHDWTALQIHTESTCTQKPLPRPLISGLPPHRIYVHPDDQIDELKRGVQEGDVTIEREWVLPTHLKEKWTLEAFAEVFDAIEEAPTENQDPLNQAETLITSANTGVKKRTGGKRLILATLGDDSTVVYYVVHDGIVKPRQN